MSDARKCRWQPVGNSDRLAPRATGRDGRAVRDRCDLQLLAEGWDRCVKSLRYEDGSPVEIVSDCCGIYARTMLLDGGKWYIWEETKHYKTEKSAVKAAGKLLACHKLSIA